MTCRRLPSAYLSSLPFIITIVGYAIEGRLCHAGFAVLSSPHFCRRRHCRTHRHASSPAAVTRAGLAHAGKVVWHNQGGAGGNGVGTLATAHTRMNVCRITIMNQWTYTSCKILVIRHRHHHPQGHVTRYTRSPENQAPEEGHRTCRWVVGSTVTTVRSYRLAVIIEQKQQHTARFLPPGTNKVTPTSATITPVINKLGATIAVQPEHHESTYC